MYTVKQMADLAGVSRRTLQYYDRIGLLKADGRTASDYRRYGEESLYRLQQILLFREMGLDLKSIGAILDCPSFELKRALEEHGKALQARIERLERLKRTVDDTIGRLTGENEMKDRELFGGLSPEQEEAYRREAVERWGMTAEESHKTWNGYSPAVKESVLKEGKEIYGKLARRTGDDPASEEVQRLIREWHDHLRNFYEPTPEILRGLGDMYCDDPRFRETMASYHEDLPEFMRKAIGIYVSARD